MLKSWNELHWLCLLLLWLRPLQGWWLLKFNLFNLFYLGLIFVLPLTCCFLRYLFLQKIKVSFWPVPGILCFKEIVASWLNASTLYFYFCCESLDFILFWNVFGIYLWVFLHRNLSVCKLIVLIARWDLSQLTSRFSHRDAKFLLNNFWQFGVYFLLFILCSVACSFLTL